MGALTRTYVVYHTTMDQCLPQQTHVSNAVLPLLQHKTPQGIIKHKTQPTPSLLPKPYLVNPRPPRLPSPPSRLHILRRSLIPPSTKRTALLARPLLARRPRIPATAPPRHERTQPCRRRAPHNRRSRHSRHWWGAGCGSVEQVGALADLRGAGRRAGRRGLRVVEVSLFGVGGWSGST